MNFTLPLQKGTLTSAVHHGPGSRGGKVIGHCATGKPVYAHGPQTSASYTHADHADAADIHAAHAQISTGDKKHHHQWMSGYHAFRAGKMAAGDAKKSLSESAAAGNLHIGEPSIAPKKANVPKKPTAAITVGRDKANGARPFTQKTYKDNADPSKPPDEDRKIYGKSKTDGNPSEPDDAPKQYGSEIRGQILAEKIKQEMPKSGKPKTEKSMQAADVLNEYLSKAGEGSHGGHIIGHTKSGKPVYGAKGHGQQSPISHNVRNFTKQDHLDAGSLHRHEAKKLTKQAESDYKTGGFEAYKPTAIKAERHHFAADVHMSNAAHAKKSMQPDTPTEKSMDASQILMDYLEKSHGGQTVAECAEISPDYAETATGKDPSDVFPHKNQKVSQAEDDGGMTTYPANAPAEAGLRQDGFSGFENQETSPGESMRDLGAGRGEEVPEPEKVVLNENDALKIGNKERVQAYERSQANQNDGEQHMQKGLLHFTSNSALDRRCAEMVSSKDFYFGEAPTIASPMGQHQCLNKSCNGPIPNFLTACPHCGNGQVLHRSFGASESPFASEAALQAPTAAQDYCPNGLRFK